MKWEDLSDAVPGHRVRLRLQAGRGWRQEPMRITIAYYVCFIAVPAMLELVRTRLLGGECEKSYQL
jgi:hypothetical protein